MPARRFLGYFLALAACSTIAFASSGLGPPAPPDAAETERALAELPLPYSVLHRHQVTHPQHVSPAPVQVAQLQ